MQTFFRVAAIFFGLGIIGNLLDSEFSPTVLVVAVICSYFGWIHDFSGKKKEVNEEKKKMDNLKATEAIKPQSARFTEAQKHALICCLYVVASGDDEVHPREQDYITKVVNVLEYWDFDETKIVTNILHNREMIIEVIRGFNDYQRKYLMYCMDGVIKADWEVNEMEMAYAGSIIEQAGFSVEEFENIVIRK